MPVSCCACVAKGSTRRESRKPMEAGFEGAMLSCERRTGLQARTETLRKVPRGGGWRPPAGRLLPLNSTECASTIPTGSSPAVPAAFAPRSIPRPAIPVAFFCICWSESIYTILRTACLRSLAVRDQCTVQLQARPSAVCAPPQAQAYPAPDPRRRRAWRPSAGGQDPRQLR